MWWYRILPKTHDRSELLRSAAIYGANASGKTNLLRGLQTMSDIVLNASGSLDELPVTPFPIRPRVSYPTDIV